MSFLMLFRVAMICFALWLAGAALLSLSRGEMRRWGRHYRRSEAPRDFWFAFTMAIASALLVAVVALLIPTRTGQSPTPILLILPLLLASNLADSLWWGRASAWRGSILKTQNPRSYWEAVAIDALLFFASALMAAYVLIRDGWAS